MSKINRMAKIIVQVTPQTGDYAGVPCRIWYHAAMGCWELGILSDAQARSAHRQAEAWVS